MAQTTPGPIVSNHVGDASIIEHGMIATLSNLAILAIVIWAGGLACVLLAATRYPAVF